ncbi:piezo-type mechanosensitive ion channel component-like isoform X2 [Rhopalosiphum padi]|nr:piezo-type mechanosensitive ion channel component-like isoform X2 [Rhopalosiphum padi]
MEWFKMDELFTHVCCVKSINNFRELLDSKRGMHVSWIFKLCVGGGIILAILIIIIFPIIWFSMFESKPDTPSSMELTVTFGEDSTVFSSKSDDIHRLDIPDLILIKQIYLNSSKEDRDSISDFLNQYEYDEISSMNVMPQSINTRPITTYEFNKFKKIILTSFSIKISAEWALTHHDGVKVSRGKNTVMMTDYTHSVLADCLNNMLNKSSNDVPGSCKQVVIPNLLPKFLALFLKSTETAVSSELMIHNPTKPYMDVGLTFHYDDLSKFNYWWDMVEICPIENENTSYLRKLPYSSCADNDINLGTTNSTRMNTMYNIYVFSDRYSSTMQFLDDRGIIGLYTIIIVYFGYKFAFDIFRSFKFKLGYTETPYPDRILQLCYEIYMVRFFGEYEMEEDLYAMLIFLFRSPETLIRFTRRPQIREPETSEPETSEPETSE